MTVVEVAGEAMTRAVGQDDTKSLRELGHNGDVLGPDPGAAVQDNDRVAPARVQHVNARPDFLQINETGPGVECEPVQQNGLESPLGFGVLIGVGRLSFRLLRHDVGTSASTGVFCRLARGRDCCKPRQGIYACERGCR